MNRRSHRESQANFRSTKPLPATKSKAVSSFIRTATVSSSRMSPLPNVDGDIFIPRDYVEDAMHGDTVIARLVRLSGIPGARRAEGRIVRIVGRAHPSVVGLFRYTAQGCIVIPYDPASSTISSSLPAKNSLLLSASNFYSGKKEQPGRGKRLPHIPKLDGAVVNAELLHYGRGGTAPAGRVIEILGRPGDLGVDTEIIIRKHHLPHAFSRRSPARS